jgi:hypothetical protein
MEKIRLSIFDFFAYLLPGAIIILTIAICLDSNVTQITNTTKLFEEIKLGTGLVAISLAYLIGFIIDSPAYRLYCLLVFKLGPIKYNSEASEKSNIIQKQALLNHFSERNFNFLLRWKALKDMSQNLILSALSVSVVALVKATRVDEASCFEWIFLAIVALLSCPILFHRAKKFDKKFYKDLDFMVDILQLEEMALNKDLHTKAIGTI